MIKVGHVGSGKPWDDGGKNAVSRIFISHGSTNIISVEFQYVDNGAFVLSEKHGGDNFETFDVVKLDYINGRERIIYVSGTENVKLGCVTSIKFTTNQRTYGPFGSPGLGPKPFEYNMGVGFGGFLALLGIASIPLEFMSIPLSLDSWSM